MKTITFPDSYTVEINDRGLVTIRHGGKTASAHCTHFKSVPAGSQAEKILTTAGKSLDDYLFANPAGEMILRATNGVREAVAEAVEESNRIAAERDAKFADERNAQIASAKSACGLSNPELVQVDYFDGYPNGIVIGGRKISNPDYSKISVGNYSFIEADEALRLVAEFDVAAKAKADKKAEDAARVDAAFWEKRDEARITGKPVILRSYTTSRCHCGNDDECSFDSAVEFVTPEGKVETKYSCCY